VKVNKLTDKAGDKAASDTASGIPTDIATNEVAASLERMRYNSWHSNDEEGDEAASKTT
jgi:hypothetical protein